MFIFGYFFIALAKIVGLVFNLYIFLIIVDTVLTWLKINNYSEHTRMISRLVDPYLSIIRSIIPPFSGMDFSPLIGILIIYFLDEFIINVIRTIGEALI